VKIHSIVTRSSIFVNISCVKVTNHNVNRTTCTLLCDGKLTESAAGCVAGGTEIVVAFALVVADHLPGTPVFKLFLSVVLRRDPATEDIITRRAGHVNETGAELVTNFVVANIGRARRNALNTEVVVTETSSAVIVWFPLRPILSSVMSSRTS